MLQRLVTALLLLAASPAEDRELVIRAPAGFQFPPVCNPVTAGAQVFDATSPAGWKGGVLPPGSAA